MRELHANAAAFGFPRKRRLTELGLRHGTDKVSATHTNYGRTYLDVYELYFEAMREEELVFAEIGVLNGESLRAWRDYFPRARVIGIDINPAAKQCESDRIRVEILSQDDEEGLQRLVAEVGGFDIVLDDASHVNELTIRSFEILWPGIKPGGYYIIEDVGCSHSETFVTWPGMTYTAARGVNLLNKREDFDCFIVSTLTLLDYHKNQMAFFHYYPDTLVMRKG
jgi:hypothetical protein